MSIPLYCFIEGDTIGLLVIAEATETIASLERRAKEAARLRVDPGVDTQVVYGGRVMASGSTVADARLEPLTRVDVRRTRS